MPMSSGSLHSGLTVTASSAGASGSASGPEPGTMLSAIRSTQRTLSLPASSSWQKEV